MEYESVIEDGSIKLIIWNMIIKYIMEYESVFHDCSVHQVHPGRSHQGARGDPGVPSAGGSGHDVNPGDGSRVGIAKLVELNRLS